MTNAQTYETPACRYNPTPNPFLDGAPLAGGLGGVISDGGLGVREVSEDRVRGRNGGIGLRVGPRVPISVVVAVSVAVVAFAVMGGAIVALLVTRPPHIGMSMPHMPPTGHEGLNSNPAQNAAQMGRLGQ